MARRQTIRYGLTPDHEGDLHLPDATRPPVVCLLHGGFWRMPWGRDQMTAVAEDLARRGFAVWNLEYRRLGVPGAGWPGTMEDVATGIEHLAKLAAGGVALDLERITAVGHSAGGQLALWAAGRSRTSRVPVRAAVGLAPIADLARACVSGIGGSVVKELMGGEPDRCPARYQAASPMAMLPLGVRQLILHGTADPAVPIELSRGYARAAADAGDEIELIELADTGHMEFLEPSSEAHGILCRRLQTWSA